MSDIDIAVLKFLWAFREENGYNPSMREIGEAVHIPSTSGVSRAIKRLLANNYVKKTPNVPRATSVTDAGREFLVDQGQATEKFTYNNTIIRYESIDDA